MKLGDVGLRAQIMSGSVFPMVIIVFLAVTGVMTLRFAVATAKSVDGIADVSQRVADVQKSVVDMEKALLAYLLSGGDQQLGRYETARAAVSAGLTDLKKQLSDKPKEVKDLEAAGRAIEKWRKDFAKPAIEKRPGASDLKTVTDLYSAVWEAESRRQLDAVSKVLASFRARANAVADKKVQAGSYYGMLTENLVIYGVTGSIVLTLVISYLLAQRINTRLSEAVNLAEDISEGDLSRNLTVKGKDEIGRLGSSLNAMVENLRNQTRQMSDAVNILSTSAAEISTTVAQLAQSTSTTSTAVTETTTTVEEVKQAARMASDKSKDVARMAEESVRVSSDGRKATEETVSRMNMIKSQMESVGETVVRLSEHSQAIEEIIQSVQDLADQSNLLAVNASIEAARAGEHGKGFSIVAHEIKTLADQSKESTDQIRSILDETRKWVSAVVMATEQGTKAVDKGVEQSLKAGEAISALSKSVTESAHAASVIRTSSEQQFSGVDQVSSAMAGIDKAVHQNLAGTQDLEGAVQRLKDLGHQLRLLVTEYRT